MAVLDWLQQVLGGTMGEMPTAAPQNVPNALQSLATTLTTPAWPQVQQSDEATRALIDQGRYADATRQGLDNPMLGAWGGNIKAAGAPIRAYHGSPHDFDRFDLSKIGTGEGAQAYGHGLYFAEKESVARGYRDALARPDVVNDPVGHVWDRLYNSDVSRSELLERLDNARNAAFDPARRKFWEDGIRAIETGAVDKYKPPGHMYEVDIHADPQRFLDWDRPLGEQPAARRAFGAVVDQDLSRQETGWTKLTGEEAYRAAVERAGIRGGGEAALRDAGIPGIRYLDAGSRIDPAAIQRQIAMHEANLKGGGASAAERAQWEDRIAALRAELTRPQTSNYAVFDDSLVEILRKYGLLPPVAAGGLLGAGQGDEAQAY